MKLVGFALSFLFITSMTFAQQSFEKKLQTQLIMAEDGDIINLPEGRYEISKSLSLEGKSNITIVGKGMDKTILSFKKQIQGAEGLRIENSNNIILKDFSVENAKGDAIKTIDVKGISFVGVKTEWTGKPSKKNGAYGLYPVSCSNVLIENCVARGASDAGIYVGQSRNIIVRNSKAINNVAGIEIENSINADVYNNEAINNTGGILIFDLPDLVQKKGGNVRVFDNKIIENNYKNFAPKGNIVGQVPPGTGVMILATSDVEVFNNEITNNRTVGVAIASYYIAELPIKDKEYDPYPTSIFVHDNTIERKRRLPTLKNKLGILIAKTYKKDPPTIIFDGILNKEILNKDGQYNPEHQICIMNNTNTKFVNLNLGKGINSFIEDITPHQCERTALKETKLSFND